jgi:cytochrome bd-type quinol oxidase subunit 2
VRPPTADPGDRRHGPGRVILALYLVFVIGTVSRSAAQISTRWEQAPLAYALSAVAAAIYLVALVSLSLRGTRAWWVSLVALSVELAGVLVVGTWSYLAPQMFPDQTVWSHFGQGYLFIPLVLPAVGLWWLLGSRGARAGTAAREPR